MNDDEIRLKARAQMRTVHVYVERGAEHFEDFVREHACRLAQNFGWHGPWLVEASAGIMPLETQGRGYTLHTPVGPVSFETTLAPGRFSIRVK